MKIALILFTFLFQANLFAEADLKCSELKEKIKSISKKQLESKNSKGETLAEVQKNYDKNKAHLIILKGLKQIRDQYLLDLKKIKEPINTKMLKNKSSKKKLEYLKKEQNNIKAGLKSSKKLLATEELLKRPSKNVPFKKYLKDLESDCKSSKTSLCEGLKNEKNQVHKPTKNMIEGFYKAKKLVGAPTPDFYDLLSNGIPGNDKRTEEILTIIKLENSIVRAQDCIKENKNSCSKAIQKINPIKKELKNNLGETPYLRKLVERISLLKRFGNLKTIEKTIERKSEKNSGVKSRLDKDLIKGLEKKIQTQFTINKLNQNLRDNLKRSTRLRKIPKISLYKLSPIYKDLFKKLDCPHIFKEENLLNCVKKFNKTPKDELESLIQKAEVKDTALTLKVNEITKKSPHPSLNKLKGVLNFMALKSCKQEIQKSKLNKNNFSNCMVENPGQPTQKIHRFSLDVGKVIAKLEPDLDVANFNNKIAKTQISKICGKKSSDKELEKLKSGICQDLSKSHRGKKKNVSKRKKKKRKRKPINWVAMGEKYNIERNDQGQITRMYKWPGPADYFAAPLAKMVKELAPVGMNYYLSDPYLDKMGDQAYQQKVINESREIAPYHTYLWDMGYRDFPSGFTGGPTPMSPGTTGIGALGRGNTYGGQGIYQPYFGSNGYPNWYGMPPINPLDYGSFQNGTNYSISPMP